MGSVLSQETETETETKTHEQTDKKSIKHPSSQVSNQQKVVEKEMESATPLTILQTETKNLEEIDQNSIKDQPLHVTDLPKEKSNKEKAEKFVEQEKQSSIGSTSTKTLESETQNPEEIGQPKEEGEEKKEDDDTEEEEEECGFCVFMKGGGCKETFVAWESCIEAVEKETEDIAEKCFKVTSALKKCMEEHPDYYEPILEAEKAAEQKVINEFDKMQEEEKANRSVDKDAIVEEEKYGFVASGVKEDSLLKEAVVEVKKQES